MGKITQLSIVKDYLINDGYVSRNICIREHYVTRLGAIINLLKKKGWKFKTEDRNGDFIYLLVFQPSNFDKNIWDKKVVEERIHNYHNPKLF